MASRPFELPDMRRACRDTMVRELVLRCFTHDVRGAVMGAQGWVELASMEGQPVPRGLQRSLDRLTFLIGRYEELQPSDSDAGADVAEVLRMLGIPFVGEAPVSSVSGLRLAAALEAAAPRECALAASERHGRSWCRLTVLGLDEAAMHLALSPHYEGVAEAVAASDARLGAALLRVVARAAGGDVQVGAPGLDIYLPANA